ncbi:MAG: Asp-tRNA(Asn)/Glu-tRNA(Gln) amidotransferase subunit GatA [Patescibacteria group bacterium]|jgi:aspartyl-tRNA(Asn)/glutamyl-tRNA(Gln) amidotransferase subunit A
MKTAIEMRKAIANGEITAEELVKASLEKIHAEDAKIGAFLETYDEEALERARAIDARLRAGEECGRLAGIPVAIKDNMCQKGHKTSAGSHILIDYVATYDSTLVHRLEAAGAIIVGRTNMDEFAMGSSTETSYFQKTRNPVDTTKVPGGSSGGSAAAVSAGFVPLAFGSDTGGSIRQPASLCGVVGLKPTYGRVSRYGLIALGSSLDQIGPFALTVEDVALALEVIEGKDEFDATSREVAEKHPPELLNRNFLGVKIGVPKQAFVIGMDEGVKARVEEAIEKMKNAGATMVHLDLPLLEYALPVYYILQPAEASSNLGRFDGMRYGTRADVPALWDSYRKTRGNGFGREVKRRIMLGSYILSAGYYDAYYKKALAVRTAIDASLTEAFKSVDVIVLPTSPNVAWTLGEKFDDPIAMYLADIYTVAANICGIPGISVPCGESEGLPVGLQFWAPSMEDGRLLDVAASYEALQI